MQLWYLNAMRGLLFESPHHSLYSAAPPLSGHYAAGIDAGQGFDQSRDAGQRLVGGQLRIEPLGYRQCLVQVEQHGKALPGKGDISAALDTLAADSGVTMRPLFGSYS